MTLLLGTTTAAGPAPIGAGARSYHLDIPRQPLDGALSELARETGLQIARFSDTPGGEVLAGPLSGDMPVGKALATLLGPSGLTYKMINDRTIAVVTSIPVSPSPVTSVNGTTKGQPPARAPGDSPKEGKRHSSGPFRASEGGARVA